MPQVTVVSATRTWVANIVSSAVTTIVPIGSVGARTGDHRRQGQGARPSAWRAELLAVAGVGGAGTVPAGLARVVVMTRAGVRLPQNLRGRLHTVTAQ
jgi:hypothetical protein